MLKLYEMGIKTKLYGKDEYSICFSGSDLEPDSDLKFLDKCDLGYIDSVSSKNPEALKELVKALSHPDIKFGIGQDRTIGVEYFKLKEV